ncbi:hypothetical protein [Prosthecobacter sp.]|uniref:hypothetical protein n=1 Tax=Prosthecobacter sp. TaxID=1965333 RepID=UPI0024881085|nr:hypothetical protein [Prosthecobacter sp.]MDI1313382.1 hypothetical protein [Prosthecobacter sp.]
MRINVTIALLLALSGCGKQSAKVVVPPLPKVEIADVPSPASPTVVVEKGSNLRAIATAAYHHESFSSIIGLLNEIPKPELLEAGATLKTPSIPVAFRDAGLDPQYQPAINALALAWTDVVAILPSYIRARDASAAKNGDKFTVPDEIKTMLLKCAGTVDASLDALRHPHGRHVAPRPAIRQFAGASRSLRRFSTGFVESRDYDTYLAEQGFGIGFSDLLSWLQANYK